METNVEVTKVGIIGMGEMGAGMAEQLRQNTAYSVTEVRRGDDLVVLQDQDITLVAIRPQQWGETDKTTGKRASDQIAEYVSGRGVFTWIMAGIETRRMRQDLGNRNIALVRAMLTLTVDGYAQIALYAEEGTLTADQKAHTEAFYAQFGNYMWLDSEDKFSEYTLFSASMIAFLASYLLAHKAHALKAGFSDAESENMLVGALRSAAHLVDRGYSLEQIDEKVTTEGGMTDAAKKASSRRNALHRLTRAMIRAGVKRAQELAKS